MYVVVVNFDWTYFLGARKKTLIVELPEEMIVPPGIKMFLPPLLILVLGGYTWGLGGNLSVTYNPISSISLEDIPPPFCSVAAPNSSHNFRRAMWWTTMCWRPRSGQTFIF